MLEFWLWKQLFSLRILNEQRNPKWLMPKKSILQFRHWVNKSVSLRKNCTIVYFDSLLARPNFVIQDIHSRRGKKKFQRIIFIINNILKLFLCKFLWQSRRKNLLPRDAKEIPMKNSISPSNSIHSWSAKTAHPLLYLKTKTWRNIQFRGFGRDTYAFPCMRELVLTRFRTVYDLHSPNQRVSSFEIVPIVPRTNSIYAIHE